MNDIKVNVEKVASSIEIRQLMNALFKKFPEVKGSEEIEKIEDYIDKIGIQNITMKSTFKSLWTTISDNIERIKHEDNK